VLVGEEPATHKLDIGGVGLLRLVSRRRQHGRGHLDRDHPLLY
jgi:hypothetical protein